MRLFLPCLLLLYLCLPSLLLAQQFDDISISAGILHSFGTGPAGGGVSFCDFNGDGWDDLTLASESGDSIYFYLNQNGTFSRIRPGLAGGTEETKHILWVDYDNDGDKDLFVTAYNAPNRLYNNDGNLVLTEVTAAVGLPLESLPSYGACWGDYDRDGWLDLYVTDRRILFQQQGLNSNRLYRNLGNGTFAETTLAAGVADSAKAPFCASFLDINGDLWPDIYIAQDKTMGNTLLKNRGNGTFEDISAPSGAGLIMNAMCVAFGDYDNDGDLDIYISNTPHGNKLLRNNGDETFTELADAVGVGFYSTGWGSNFLDYDNDGDLDLYVSGMVPGAAGPGHLSSAMYENNGAGMFSISAGIGMPGDTVASFANAVGDMNQDGYPDLFVSNTAPWISQLWANSGGANHWIQVKLEGVMSNRDGIGAWIEVYTGGQKQVRYTHCGIGFLGQNSDTETFGLGQWTAVDSIVVRWPSGHVDRRYGPVVGERLLILENEGIHTALRPESEKPGRLLLYPQPAQAEMYLRWESPHREGLQAGIYDLAGRRLQGFSFSSGHTHPLKTDVLPAGMYYLIIRGENGEIHARRSFWKTE